MEIKLSEAQKNQLLSLGVLAVYLFGSVAEGYKQPHSDVDIGVIFKNPLPANTLELYNQLDDIFAKTFPHKELDIVLVERATLELKADMITHGQVIFDADPDRRMEFEERILLLYADFKPKLEYFNRAVLDKIP